MYGWIWRHLPFGLPGKLIGSLGLAVATAALLWYVVFPRVEPLLPFDDVQVTQDGGTQQQVPAVSESPSPGESDFDIPYATHTNNPPPSPSR
jgi:hypothetical protein